MKTIQTIGDLKYWALLLASFNLIISCQPDQSSMSATERERVMGSVTLMTRNIARDISANGPIAWLNYFGDVQGFFMASEGQLALKDYPTAKTFISQTLIKSIPRIKLNMNNLRIDPLTTHLAAFGADFHEDITYADSATVPADGYLTGIAELATTGWRLRNLHWSLLKAK